MLIRKSVDEIPHKRCGIPALVRTPPQIFNCTSCKPNASGAEVNHRDAAVDIRLFAKAERAERQNLFGLPDGKSGNCYEEVCLGQHRSVY